MERNELLGRISIDPHVCFGKPCIRGHRIWVSLVLDLLASGLSVEEVLEEYPQLSREDVLACVAYGAEKSRERFVDVSLEDEESPRLYTPDQAVTRAQALVRRYVPEGRDLSRELISERRVESERE